jgi:hypothetical protein
MTDLFFICILLIFLGSLAFSLWKSFRCPGARRWYWRICAGITLLGLAGAIFALGGERACSRLVDYTQDGQLIDKVPKKFGFARDTVHFICLDLGLRRYTEDWHLIGDPPIVFFFAACLAKFGTHLTLLGIIVGWLIRACSWGRRCISHRSKE